MICNSFFHFTLGAQNTHLLLLGNNMPLPLYALEQRMMAGKEGIMSLAQGIVHWQPPAEALSTLSQACMENSSHS
jgi:hypothetical protein